jgi:Ca-activated chloride channel family protein
LAQGHILLVTDGADADSIERARVVLGDYRLSVLAMGAAEGAPFPVAGGGFLKDRQGNIAIAKLETAELSELASLGRGIYQTATADDDDVKHLSAMFNKAVDQDPQAQSDLRLQNWDEKGPWLLLLALPWAVLRFRRGLLAFLFLLCLPFPNDAWALDWQSLWQTQDQRAQQAFSQQQYQEAAERFNDPNWRAAAQYKAGQYQQAAETLKDTQSAEGHYNRGNALAKAGQLQEAFDAYNQALKLAPQHADANYNKELVEKELKKQQNQDKQSSSSEQSSPDQKPQSDQAKQQNQNQQDPKDPQQNQDPSKQQPGESKSTDGSKQNQDKQPEPETDKPDDARRSSSNPKPEKQAQQEPVAKPSPEQDEAKRANEQLLRRIPDEPTGLLKRKFKYQYGQRDPPPHSGPAW